MLTRTRSDLLLETSHLDRLSRKEKDELIWAMYHKIEAAYTICFGLEEAGQRNDGIGKAMGEIGTLLRTALESE